MLQIIRSYENDVCGGSRTLPQYDQLVSHVCYDIISCQLRLSSTNTHIIHGEDAAEVVEGSDVENKGLKSGFFYLLTNTVKRYLYNRPFEEKIRVLVCKFSTD